MDVRCPNCGEPWDMGEFHYVPERSYQEVAADFRARGCEAMGAACSEPLTERDATFGLTPATAAGALYELLGDDMDGAAAMLEDMGL